MAGRSPDYQMICLKCGALYESSESNCPKCGHINAEAPPTYQSSRKQKAPSGSLLPDMSFLIKATIAVLVLALGSWLIYQACDKIYRSVEPSDPHPTDPAVTVTEFFEALQDEDYQSCYGLLNKERKMAAAIGKHERDAYFNHFMRIRHYLTQRVAQDFAWDMQVSPDGKQVQFGLRYELTMSLIPTRGHDKLSHYAIKEINEFPIDIAPGIGVEQYQRQLNRIIESADALAQDNEDMDVADILETRAHESAGERRNRLMEAFGFQRQLDTRHTLLEWIIQEYPQDSTTRSFLAKIARDDAEVIQLRELARDFLNDNTRRP